MQDISLTLDNVLNSLVWISFLRHHIHELQTVKLLWTGFFAHPVCASAIITFTQLYTPVTLKILSTFPTHVMNISDKFH